MNLDQNIVIKLLAHQDLKDFKGFIRMHWAKDHIFSHENAIFNWQHKGLQTYHYMVAKQRGTLVGVQGVIPQSHFDKYLPKAQIFLTLWKVLETKGIGIGLRLYQNILKEYKPNFIGVIGINQEIIPFYKWQGFTVGIMNHHVALPPDVTKLKIAKVPEALRSQSRKIKLDVSFQKVSEKYFAKIDTKELYIHQWPLKSDIYILNRYINHPVYTYEVYAISKNNKLRSLCVIRPIFKDNSVVLRFVDFIGPNEAFSLLHNFVLDLLKKYNAEYLDIYSHGIPTILLQKAGFINRKKIKGLIIPNYFEPFERKNVDLMFAFKNWKTDTPVRLFKADGDQDRPNQIEERTECLKNSQ